MDNEVEIVSPTVADTEKVRVVFFEAAEGVAEDLVEEFLGDGVHCDGLGFLFGWNSAHGFGGVWWVDI